MNWKKTASLIAFTLAFGANAAETTKKAEKKQVKATPHHHEAIRPDAHAPIGVMGDHGHNKGEIMLSYRVMAMTMDENMFDGDTIEASEIVSTTGYNYMVAPTEMTMLMHMLGMMYGVSDKLTLSVMAGFTENEMDHVTRMGQEFTTSSSGLNDVKLGALYQLSTVKNSSLLVNLAVSLNTGDIEAEDETPMSGGNPAQLPYPMQLGSGTYDVIAGFTFQQWMPTWSWGSQALYTHHIGENDRDYTLGNHFHVTTWASYRLHNNISTSIRMKYQERENIDGADAALNPMMVQTADTRLHAYKEMHLGAGANLTLGSHRLAVEFLGPVWQHVDGPQLVRGPTLTAGWQFAF